MLLSPTKALLFFGVVGGAALSATTTKQRVTLGRVRPIVAPSVAKANFLALGAELATYFADAFGNATRIDYGTGHELSFFAWLLGLEEAGLLEAADRPAVVARVLGR